MKMKKSSNISAAALHRFIPQPASGRSSALPCLAANIVLSKLLWEIHLHSLKFIPDISVFKANVDCIIPPYITEITIEGNYVMFSLNNGFISFYAKNISLGIPKE